MYIEGWVVIYSDIVVMIFVIIVIFGIFRCGLFEWY